MASSTSMGTITGVLMKGLELQTVLIFVCVLLVSWYIIDGWLQKQMNLPPGPKGFLAGLAVQMRVLRNFSMPKLNKVLTRHDSSDIVASRFGSQTMITLNSFSLIKDTFTKRDDVVDRPPSLIMNKLSGFRGIIGSNGKLWREQRRFVLSVLRDFGMGKMGAEEKIKEEANALCEELKNLNGEPLDMQYIIGTSVANIICSIAFGKRYNYDDADFVYYLKLINDNFRYSSLASMAGDNYPLLQYLPGDLFKVKKLTQNYHAVLNFIQSRIDDSKAKLDPDNVASFIDAYLVEIERQKKLGRSSSFDEEQLRFVVSDLFVAGTETTATTLRWAVLQMMLNGKVQARVQREIDDNIGRERPPRMADRHNLPYTEAVLMEIQREASIFPFGAPHTNSQLDVTIDGYNVPKNSVVLSNLWWLHHHPDHWKHPGSFNPDNFLDKSGKLMHSERLIPFNIGRRSCPGEALAKMELFLFFVSMLQRFTFKIPDGAPRPSSDPVLSVSLQPKPFKVAICARR